MPYKGRGKYDGPSEARTRASEKYKAKFRIMGVSISLEEHELIREYGLAHGESVNAFINRAILYALDSGMPPATKTSSPVLAFQDSTENTQV